MIKHGLKVIVIFLVMAFCLQNVMANAGEQNIRVQGSIGQKYDDNITYDSSDEVSDFITTLGTGIDLNYTNRRTSAKIKARIVEQLYLDLTENNNSSQYLTMTVKHDLTKYDSFSLSNSFSHSSDPYTLEEQFGRTGGRYDSYRNQLDLSYVKNFSKRLSMRFGYQNNIDQKDRSDLLDSYINKVLIDGIYSSNAKTTFFLGYEFLDHELGSVGNATIHTVNGGIKYFLTEQFSIESRMGIDFIDSFNGNSLIEPMWSVMLSNQITEKESVDLSFSKRYSTNSYTEDVFDSWQVSSKIHSQLSRKLSSSLEMFYGQGTYDSSDVEESFLGGDASLSYEINKNLRGNVAYKNTQTTSNVESNEYKKNVISVGIVGEF